MDKDDKLIEFDSKSPHTLPEDWKDKLAPTVYEVLATSNTLKKMYSEQVKDIKKGVISVELGEENLRNIATNYQTIKNLLFQPR